MGQIRRLDATGDTKFEWNPIKPDEVEAARAVFDEYRRQGFAAARMEGTTTGEIIKDFDPNVGIIVFVPPMAGG
jgi:hypothetical protein